MQVIFYISLIRFSNMKKNKLPQIKRIFPDFDSLRIPFSYTLIINIL